MSINTDRQIYVLHIGGGSRKVIIFQKHTRVAALFENGIKVCNYSEANMITELENNHIHQSTCRPERHVEDYADIFF